MHLVNISHCNVHPDIFNKLLLENYGNNLEENTIIALQILKDKLHKIGVLSIKYSLKCFFVVMSCTF